jgi:hypothetical protein
MGALGAVAQKITERVQQTAAAYNAIKHAGIISCPECGIKIRFQYNPEEIVDANAPNWTRTESQGGMSPVYTFSCGGDTTKRFVILLDAHASPKLEGHVGKELDQIELLRVPHDKSGKPIALPALRVPAAAPSVSSDVVGIPPIVTIVYGGRVQKGFVSSIQITEMLHGTTLQAAGSGLPTRARVEFDFVIVEDRRLLVGGAGSSSTGGGGGASSSTKRASAT